jgi:hypothetical protein
MSVLASGQNALQSKIVSFFLEKGNFLSQRKMFRVWIFLDKTRKHWRTGYKSPESGADRFVAHHFGEAPAGVPPVFQVGLRKKPTRHRKPLSI